MSFARRANESSAHDRTRQRPRDRGDAARAGVAGERDAAASEQEPAAGATVETIASARARLEAGEAEVGKKRRAAERARTLAKSGSIAATEVDDAEAALAVAIAERDIRAQELKELKR